MPTKESFISYSRETFRSHEQTSSVPRDRLYDSLLLAPSSHEAILPQNTYTMRLDSRTFSPDVLTELSDTIDSTREARLQGARGRQSESLSSLDSAIKMDRLNGKTEANITIAYSGVSEPGPDGLHVPTAVIVHEALQPEEIRQLREALPSGVLILDGETNELLDETGAAEREVGRKIYKIYRDMGETAFRTSRIREGATYSAFEDIMSSNDLYFGTHQSEWIDTTPFFEASSMPDAGAYKSRAESPSASRPTKESSIPTIPESDEVREYEVKDRLEQAEIAAHEENDFRNRTKAGDALFDAANDLYGVPHLGGLDSAQLRKVERKVFSQLHPDRGFQSGGDQGAYKEAGVLMDKIRKHNEAKADASKEGNN